MKGDFSRLTFDPKKHYSGVRMQQGRMQLDADWNEQVDITEHRIENLFTDLIGDSGAPQGDHFKIRVEENVKEDFNIGKGRIYVAGLLCENGETCSFIEQPYLPGVKLPEEDGPYVCYLDVWQRLITVLEDPDLREPALGGPDTATRFQNVWQVKLEKMKDETKDELEKILKGLKENAISTGKMTAKWDPQSTHPENRLYRVEIHKGGALDTATFKWSRDNGAIAARVVSISSNNTKGLTIVLSQEGPATQSWFTPNEYIEFSNEALTLNREPGILAKLVRVEGLTLTTENGKVALTEQQTDLLKKWPPEEPGENPIVRRWDSSGEVKVEAADNDGWIELEHGIRIKFEKGNYKAGDYWLIPSRMNDPQGIMFPKEAQPPKGVQHYYAPIALLERSRKKWQVIKDQLFVFSPLTTGLVSKAGDTMTGPLTIDYISTAQLALNVKGDVHVEGNVGIGTSDSRAKMEVTGDIRGSTVSGASWSHTEKIKFPTDDMRRDYGIQIAGPSPWLEIKFYTRSLMTPALSSLHVTLNIPFVGNEKAGSRNGIRLDFDGEPICDAMFHPPGDWSLHSITLSGMIKNVSEGEHTMQVFAVVSFGVLYIPHFNPKLDESFEPNLFANLYLIGFY